MEIITSIVAAILIGMILLVGTGALLEQTRFAMAILFSCLGISFTVIGIIGPTRDYYTKTGVQEFLIKNECISYQLVTDKETKTELITHYPCTITE